MDEAETDALACVNFPWVHSRQICSRNPLERLSAEVKRGANVVGIFR